MIDQKKAQQLYLLSFSICLIASFLETTILNNYIPIKVLKYVSLISLLIKICFCDRYNKKQLLLLLLLGIGVILTVYFSTYKSIFICFIFVVGAKDVSFKEICKYYFYISLFLMLTIFILSYTGFIENLLYYKENIVRNSFGFSHPTEFSSHTLFMLISYILYKNNNLKIIDYIVILVIDLLIYKFCYTRLDCICIVLILFVSILYNRKKIKYNNAFLKNILIFSCVICAIISIIASYNYNQNNKYYEKIDEILTYRLSLSKRAFNQNKIKIFGQQINEVNGLKKLQNKEIYYNFIDCSYVRILLKYGLFLFSVIIVSSVIFNKKLYNSNNYLLLLMIFIVSLASMVSHHYIDFSYNFLILAYLSKIDLRGEDCE